MEYKSPNIPLLLVILVLFGASIGILHGRIKNKLDNNRILAQRMHNQNNKNT